MKRIHLTLNECDAALVMSILAMHVRAGSSGDVTTADPRATVRIADRLRQMIDDRGWSADPAQANRIDRDLSRYGLDDKAAAIR